MSRKTVDAILARERRTRGEPEKAAPKPKPVAPVNPLYAEKKPE